MRAEFFGVLGTGELPETARDAFARMCAAYASGEGAGRLETAEHPGALVGVSSLRADGRAPLRTETRHVLALAGDPDRAWDACDLAGIEQQLLRGDWPEIAQRSPATAFCFISAGEGGTRAWLLGDRHGFVPVHVAHVDGLVFFSSRLAPLVRCGAVDPRLDPTALQTFLTFEHLTGDKTLHEHVTVLPAAGRWTVSRGECRADVSLPVPHVAPATDPDMTVEHAAGLLADGLRGGVAAACARSDTVAITLSGGLDSRALLGFALEAGADIRTYTFGQPGSRDALIAEAVARAVDVPHSFIPLDGSFLPRWLDHAVDVTGGAVGAQHVQILSLLDRVRAEAGAVLDGLGGDMLTGGHLSWRLAAARSREQAVDLVSRQHATGLASSAARAALFEESFLQLQGRPFDPRDAVCAHAASGAAPWLTGHRFDARERQRRFIQYGPHLYRHAVDVHTPFYSGDLPDQLQQLPLRVLMEQRAYVRMHQRSLPRVAAIPDAARGIPLSWPQGIRFGKRVADAGWRRLARVMRVPTGGAPGSTNYATWFRTECRGLLEERLLDGGDVFDGIIRRSAVEGTLREHLSGQHDHTGLLGNLLSLAVWLQGLRTQPAAHTTPGSGSAVPRKHASRGEGQVGLVAIGRNEGERLVRCLESLDRSVPAVYVDSGSTDGSVARAAEHGLEVVELDNRSAFTAARARNEGFDQLLASHPETDYVQFIDSDCELDPGWLSAARLFLDEHDDVAVVCGRRRELYPERSVYNRLADMEWNTPVGDAFTCGGDSLMRSTAFREAGAFDSTLIAGEEPDLCLRFRRAGHRVVRIDQEMTLHDVDITRFAQWWRRSARWGHGYTEMVLQHGRGAERRWVRSLVSCLAWSVGLPALAVLAALTTSPASLLLLMAYGIPLVRVYLARRPGNTRGDAFAYALACVLGKFSEFQGAVSCAWNQLVMRRRTTLIEYKDV